MVLLAATIATMVMLNRCSRQAATSQFVAASGDTLNVAIEYSPLSLYMYDDTLGGFNHDLLALIQIRAARPVKMHPIVNLKQSLELLNDGTFDIVAAQLPSTTDLKGWKSLCNAYAGNQCARFGSSGRGGDHVFIVTTPVFTLPGDTVTLTFRLAGWNAKNEGTDLQLELSQQNAKFANVKGQTILETMKKGQWQTYTYHIVGTGACTLTFTATGRFFLDDVSVTRPVTTGINRRPLFLSNRRSIFSLTGQNMGTDASVLPKGIYIVDHRKVVLGR